MKSGVTIPSGAETKTVGMFTCYKGSDGEWYVKVENVIDRSGQGITWSDGTPMTGGTKYFKMEPIKWRVLTTSYNHDKKSSTPGVKLLFAEASLSVNVAFYDDSYAERTIGGKTIYPFNYEHSRLRAYFNGIKYNQKGSENSEFYNKGFFQSAFTEEERNKILETTVDNSWEGAVVTDTTAPIREELKEKVSGDTKDRVFALNSKEFYDYLGNAVSSRIRRATDYTYALNCSYYDGVPYMLRSPSLYSTSGPTDFVYQMGSNMGQLTSAYVTGNYVSIVPALCVPNN